MAELPVQFKGEANIYLQGHDALEPVVTTDSLMTYYVGSTASRIFIKDHRVKSARAALQALNGINEEKFADVFNQPGWVEVRSSDNQAEIEIFDGRAGKDSPTLWLGVIYNKKMGVYDICWEILKPIGTAQVAFAAIIR